MDTKYKINWKYCAEIQLNRAIILFLETKEFICAITLAANSEEILGKIINEINAMDQLKEKISNTYNVEKDDAGKLMNDAKNNFKHWNKSEDDTKEFELENEAVQYICRAITNYNKLNLNFSKEMLSFIDYLKVNKLIN